MRAVDLANEATRVKVTAVSLHTEYLKQRAARPKYYGDSPYLLTLKAAAAKADGLAELIEKAARLLEDKPCA